MNMEWIKLSLSPVTDLISFLTKQSKTNDVVKKKLLIELRDNLNVFNNGFINASSYDAIIELLRTDAYEEAVKENFQFHKLRSGKIEAGHVKEERNKKYIGWDADKLMDKIHEKTIELKNLRKLNGNTLANAKNNIPAMMHNLYFRMKLLADFIRSKNS